MKRTPSSCFVCACSIMLCIFPSNEPVPKAGLFTGVVSVSLVESYKRLSPDSGDETVKRLKEVIDLTTQASHLFYNYSNGIPVQEITSANTSPTFQQSPDVVTVNVFWFNSLFICLGCAILATLIQKWARRYLALTQGRGTPAERARVRAFLSNGLIKFRSNWIRHLLGMLLHSSIFLYCLGIIVFIINIDSDVDMGLTFSAGIYLFVCYLIYSIVTILPFFFLDCPYSTPYTPLTWRLYHLCMFAISLLMVAILYLPLALLAPSLLEIFKKKTKKHMRRCWHGRKRSIELYASDAPDAATLV